MCIRAQLIAFSSARFQHKHAVISYCVQVWSAYALHISLLTFLRKRVSAYCVMAISFTSPITVDGFTILLNLLVPKFDFDRVAYYVNGVEASDGYEKYSLFGGPPYNEWKATPGAYLIKAVLCRSLKLPHVTLNITVNVVK